MAERRKQGKPTVMILNSEYKELGATSYTLELACGTCGKTFKVTKYATPPSTGQTQEEPKNEVLGVIRQAIWFTHSYADKCNGKITDKEIT